MYEARFGLQPAHLAEIAKTNYENAKRNPKSQTRTWGLDYASRIVVELRMVAVLFS